MYMLMCLLRFPSYPLWNYIFCVQSHNNSLSLSLYIYVLTCHVIFHHILYFRLVNGRIVNNTQGSYTPEVQTGVQTLYGCIHLVSWKQMSNSCVVCSITVVRCSSFPFFGCQHWEGHRENITYGAGHVEAIVVPNVFDHRRAFRFGWMKTKYICI